MGIMGRDGVRWNGTGRIGQDGPENKAQSLFTRISCKHNLFVLINYYI